MRNILGKGWAFPVTTDIHGNIASSSYEKSVEENSSSILVVDDNPEIREIIQVLL